MRVEVDPRRCCGYRVCVDIAPSVFQINSLGKASVITNDLSPQVEGAVKEAAHECPGSAISIHQASTRR
ncbi:ferredoxin [Mycobacterium intracellulare]|uniref:Ferredoxin n=1 Tax=Mycobacterium intracellulare TaxID=1767 RepID=A0AAE4RIB7_MYCIT|nr:ferredoxin [Mycobacterium intracellulare]MDV6979075.1 ferredoxin [Mycobacterium intracellulare]MDV6984483.1 ferredoxin [Mycobacterium intracellulare]MDV7014619.1 ferredoxin [Mycobacterium intracellulare]MDV7029535.1 ferredoxin [Mycobacterium intracellulare]